MKIVRDVGLEFSEQVVRYLERNTSGMKGKIVLRSFRTPQFSGQELIIHTKTPFLTSSNVKSDTIFLLIGEQKCSHELCVLEYFDSINHSGCCGNWSQDAVAVKYYSGFDRLLACEDVLLLLRQIKIDYGLVGDER